VEFTPTASKFHEERCGGVTLSITDRAAFQPIRTGLELARQTRALYPDTWNGQAYDRLLADKAVLEALLAGKTVDEIQAAYQDELEDFKRRRSGYLMY
jgi:uncharacterized protein YbbC (DUF1343 family)